MHSHLWRVTLVGSLSDEILSEPMFAELDLRLDKTSWRPDNTHWHDVQVEKTREVVGE